MMMVRLLSLFVVIRKCWRTVHTFVGTSMTRVSLDAVHLATIVATTIAIWHPRKVQCKITQRLAHRSMKVSVPDSNYQPKLSQL